LRATFVQRQLIVGRHLRMLCCGGVDLPAKLLGIVQGTDALWPALSAVSLTKTAGDQGEGSRSMLVVADSKDGRLDGPERKFFFSSTKVVECILRVQAKRCTAGTLLKILNFDPRVSHQFGRYEAFFFYLAAAGKLHVFGYKAARS
jgi:hypothetical protein